MQKCVKYTCFYLNACNTFSGRVTKQTMKYWFLMKNMSRSNVFIFVGLFIRQTIFDHVCEIVGLVIMQENAACCAVSQNSVNFRHLEQTYHSGIICIHVFSRVLQDMNHMKALNARLYEPDLLRLMVAKKLSDTN